MIEDIQIISVTPREGFHRSDVFEVVFWHGLGGYMRMSAKLVFAKDELDAAMQVKLEGEK